jgi:hypothetical protein
MLNEKMIELLKDSIKRKKLKSLQLINSNIFSDLQYSEEFDCLVTKDFIFHFLL